MSIRLVLILVFLSLLVLCGVTNLWTSWDASFIPREDLLPFNTIPY